MTMIAPRTTPSDGHDQRSHSVDELIVRWPAIRPFLLIGSGCIIAGGLVAAVTRPTGFVRGSWTAAFLVLVGGVAQIALDAGQGWLADRPPPARRVRAEAVCWNVGVAVTIVGTLAAMPIVTTAAGFALVLALGLFIATTRASSAVRRSARVIYGAMAGIVLVSIPVGLGLARSPPALNAAAPQMGGPSRLFSRCGRRRPADRSSRLLSWAKAPGAGGGG